MLVIVDFVVLVISTTLEKLFLCSLYEVGSLVTCPGPEPDPPIWKIYDGVCKQDRKVFVITIVVIVRYGQKVEY